MRLDKYLKVSRLIKRRTVANEACDGGRVSLNGKVAKAGAEVKPGDIIEVTFGQHSLKVEVVSVSRTPPRPARRRCTGNLYRSNQNQKCSETIIFVKNGAKRLQFFLPLLYYLIVVCQTDS